MLKTAIIGVVAIALAACTALRFGYNQGPELAYWWLDRYLDFDEAEESKARADIVDWFRWHRATQLPDYANLLSRAQREALDPVTPAQMCKWVDTIQSRIDTAVEHAIPTLADYVRTMSPDQIKSLERKYAKNLKEFRNDFLQPDPADRRKAQIKRIVDRAEMMYGKLNELQVHAIEQMTLESPLDPQGWYAERERRQHEALAAVRKLNADGAGAEEARAAMKRLYAEMLRSPREGYRAYQQRVVQYNCGMAAQIHNLATLEQRAHAVKRLRSWEDDARTLAAQRS